MMGWRIFALVSVFHGFLQLCGAVDLYCNVTQDGPRTTYSLSQKFPASSSNDVDYSWSNATDHVIAAPGANMSRVITSSMDTLVTSECIGHILFKGTNYAERKDYTATCTINCTAPQTAPPQVTVNVPLIVGVLIGILVLAGLCFLCYKFRDKLRRRCSCSRVLYVVVNKNNPGPRDPGV